jgi:hypothetical protein
VVRVDEDLDLEDVRAEREAVVRLG